MAQRKTDLVEDELREDRELRQALNERDTTWDDDEPQASEHQVEPGRWTF